MLLRRIRRRTVSLVKIPAASAVGFYHGFSCTSPASSCFTTIPAGTHSQLWSSDPSVQHMSLQHHESLKSVVECKPESEHTVYMQNLLQSCKMHSVVHEQGIVFGPLRHWNREFEFVTILVHFGSASAQHVS